MHGKRAFNIRLQSEGMYVSNLSQLHKWKTCNNVLAAPSSDAVALSYDYNFKWSQVAPA